VDEPLTNTVVRSDLGALRRLLILFAALALAGGVTMSLLGFRPVIPWGFVAYLALLIPGTWAVAQLLLAGARWKGPAAVWFGIGVFAIVAGTILPSVVVFAMYLAAIGAFGSVLVLNRRAIAPPALLAFVGVVLGNTWVWCGQYLLLTSVRARMLDNVFEAGDLWLYQTVLARSLRYTGWFPLVSGHALAIFELAYMSFFPQILLAVFMVGNAPRRQVEYLSRLFTCYAVAMLMFLIVPVAGPYLADPASVRTALPMTTLVMHFGQLEFDAIRHGLQPVTGFGNFVGFPSVHAALAVLFQVTLWPNDRAAFWALLPINAVLTCATVVLGYHYVVDTIAGLALGGIVTYAVRSR
jgi:membrane-associated phospholipid phosphatase